MHNNQSLTSINSFESRKISNRLAKLSKLRLNKTILKERKIVQSELKDKISELVLKSLHYTKNNGKMLWNNSAVEFKKRILLCMKFNLTKIGNSTKERQRELNDIYKEIDESNACLNLR